jgi:hypothetical protein
MLKLASDFPNNKLELQHSELIVPAVEAVVPVITQDKELALTDNP